MEVSAIIPTRNRRDLVGAAVESVLAQTLRAVEVIVVDDASTDGTADMLAATYGDRIRLERLPVNRGRSEARNAGWSLARGRLVAFLDSDDVWLPHKLELQVPLFARPEVLLVHGWVGKIDAQGHPLPAKSAIREQEFRKAALRGWDYAGLTELWCAMYTSAVVVRRELLERTGGFDAKLSNWEDWDLFWRIALLGEVATVEQVVVNHREHAGNTEMQTGAWDYVCEKHLALLDGLGDAPFVRRARLNLRVNQALAAYWRGDFRTAGARMRRLLLRHPGIALNPGHPVRGPAVCHALLPERAARSLVRLLGLDEPV